MIHASTLVSKLPSVGTSIFSQMSALAVQHQAVNLSQGFPDYPADPYLIDLVEAAMRQGHNQYAAMPGLLTLREEIASKVALLYGVSLDPATEITITAGGTQALFTAIASLVQAGDEVIIFEPAYDSYAPTVALFGGKVVPVQLLAPDFSIDWEYVRSLITAQTKLVIINNPNNPTGTLLGEADLQALEAIVQDHALFILSDEVYEHLLYDGLQHQSVLSRPSLRARSYVVASFGKLVHTTGWKIGYAIAPKELSLEFRKIHQYNVFSVNSPMQYALAQYIADPQHYLGLSAFFQQKRDFLLQGLANSRFRVQACQGTYFLLLNYCAISMQKEIDFATRLTEQYKIAMIPISAFYHNQVEQQTLRICFAKKEETLAQAIEILQKI